MVEAFCATKQRPESSAVDVHTQLFYSLLDQRFHGDTRTDSSSTTDVLAALHAEHHPLGYPERTAWHHRFSHLVGYGARCVMADLDALDAIQLYMPCCHLS